MLTLPLIPSLKVREGSHLPGILILIVFSLILLSAVNAVSTRRRTLWISTILAGVTVLFHTLKLFQPSVAVQVIAQFAAIFFLGMICVRLIKHVLDARNVTSEIVYASLCAYLMFGIA